MCIFCFLYFQKATGNDASENAAGFANLFLIALATFSTAYNVVLYVIFNPSFKRAMKGILKCSKGGEVLNHGAVSEHSPQSPPHGDNWIKVMDDTGGRLFTVKSDLTALNSHT